MKNENRNLPERLHAKDVESAVMIRNAQMNSGKKNYTVSEDLITDQCNVGDLITLDLENTRTATDEDGNPSKPITVILGTAAGTRQLGQIDALIGRINEVNRFREPFEVLVGGKVDSGDLEDVFVGEFANVPEVFPIIEDLKDQFGERAPFLDVINERFTKRPVMVSSIEVITESEAQRSVSAKAIKLPVNLESANIERMETKAVYDDYTGYELLKKPMIFGNFSGIAYDVLPGTKVSLNIHLSAVDNISFKV